MSDEQSYPTVTVPLRSDRVQEKFDSLARRIGDPMSKLFLLAAAGKTEETQLRAASELLPYRYPKLRQTEVVGEGGRGGGTAVSININLGAAPEVPAIEASASRVQSELPAHQPVPAIVTDAEPAEAELAPLDPLD